MDSHQIAARIVGALFLTASVTYMLGDGLLKPVMHAPDYLVSISENSSCVIMCILLELICGAAAVGIALTVFPILKPYNSSMALGYVGFRVIEFTFIAVGAIAVLSLLTLSREYLKAGSPDAAYFQTLGALFKAGYYWSFWFLCVSLSLGAYMFYYLLYKSKLVPRFISVWGVIGITLMLAEIVSNMFGHGLGLVSFLPGGLNELFLAGWLIIKGFDPRQSVPNLQRRI